MISSHVGDFFSWLRGLVVDVIGRLGIHPNLLTIIGFLCNMVAGYCLYLGRMKTAGAVMIFAGAFDVIDGAVARKTGLASRFGAFFDSVMDRYSDMALLIGLVFYYLRTIRPLGVLLACLALAGSIMVSYCRARSENVIDKCKVGFWERPERIVLLIIGALSGRVLSAVAILAVFTHLTVLHRIFHTFVRTRRVDAVPLADKPPDLSAGR